MTPEACDIPAIGNHELVSDLTVAAVDMLAAIQLYNEFDFPAGKIRKV